MRAAVAAVLSLTLATSACFPHNPKARTYAKIGEGVSLAAGIVVLSFAKTGADCEMMNKFGQGDSGCKDTANLESALGFGLILLGLGGFIATVSTAEADEKPAPIVTPLATPPPAPTPPPPAPAPMPIATDPNAPPPADPNAGSGAGSGSGSGSAAPIATPPAPAPVPPPPPAPKP